MGENSQKKRDYWEAQDVGGWIILKWIRERGWDGVGWIDLAQEDRDQWRAHVNTILNLRVPQNFGNFLSRCTIGGSSRRA
jgi:hypothetical protein